MSHPLISKLPEYLQERSRVHSVGSEDEGPFVLYWMRTAVRVDENPALDVAITLAEQLSLPLLVYHGLSQHYEYSSDRHHVFMLEGARDVQAKFRELGISYAFHLSTPEDSRSHLVALGEQARLVVTEEMPVDPPRRFLKKLATHVSTPILCVDTSCVVPMQLVKKPYTRAFQYRSATKDLHAERITRQWPELSVKSRPFDMENLPFQNLDLETAELSELVSQCEIDHSIGPVTDTPGGTQAGYERWQHFKKTGLAKYAKRRNNALLDGVSRMSAYLHYGMVSPLRIARESAEADNEGSKKYLDELLIWRELAYAFCFHRSDHDQWSAIPDWAQATLQSHVGDHREHIYSWEQLARAQTSDPFWNAAQTSLIRQGELHNNVRMTWGKAILNWTSGPEQALQLMIDLNHRYALDGRDPASYGGLLWCLGQFDRPFEPESAILGKVRPRSTADHARRLDPSAYRTRVATPRFDPVPHVAVIGAGMSGLFAARAIADHGLQVTVFEKSRGVGGRMSTRRVDDEPRFDHGAQYFTARDPRFLRYVQSWQEQEIVAPWPDGTQNPPQRIVVLDRATVTEKPDNNERYVAVPAMNAICTHLAVGLSVQTSTQIANVESVDARIRLTDVAGTVAGSFDRVIVAVPAAQGAGLLAEFPMLADPISKIQMRPCWAVMVTFEDAITNDWVGAFIHNSSLSWAARNSTKPGRSQEAEHVVLHAGQTWTEENWDRDGHAVAEELLAEFWRASGISPRLPKHLVAHRWKYAIPVDASDNRCFFDSASGIVACGDWAGGPRVEGAFLSGMAAAGRILGTLSRVNTKRNLEQGTLF
jgi:photolyase PhrII